MVFNSISFLIFFLIFFIIYWNIKPSKTNLRNLLILTGSYFFYGWWDWRFLSLIFISSLADFIFAWQIYRSESKNIKKLYLWSSIIVNIGLLGFFKYYNFFIDSFGTILQAFGIQPNIHSLKIILPVGISFYTFQTMSYTLDVFFGVIKPVRNILGFFSYVSFFPQLVAGPIERARNLLPQFFEHKSFSYPKTIEGLRMVLWGFFKKIVIADNFGLMADSIFNSPQQQNSLTIIAGIFLFSFQIYCDFSGYSDIAIGTARMLGFNLMQNFKTPYFAKSFQEFWQRWHISLSSWFRDYVYIPLGGNRKGNTRQALNTMLTFLLSGLWHGASYTFVIWGGLHGLLLILEKQFKKIFRVSIPFISIFIFVLASLLWLPFRAGTWQNLKILSNGILNFDFNTSILTKSIAGVIPERKLIALLITFAGFIIFEKIIGSNDFNYSIAKANRPLRIALYYTLILCIIFLGNFNVAPYFIYFQF